MPYFTKAITIPENHPDGLHLLPVCRPGDPRPRKDCGMNKWITPIITLTLAVWLSGCRGGQAFASDAAAVYHFTPPASISAFAPEAVISSRPLVAEDLLHRRFVLVSVDGKDFVVEKPAERPDLEFNEGFQIAGHVCNRFFGPAELRDGKLRAENLASTLMMCFKTELNELERLLFAMLRDGVDVSLGADGSLTLRQGEHALVYEKADWLR